MDSSSSDGQVPCTAYAWRERDVVDVLGAEFVTRTYLEQASVRGYLAMVADRLPLRCVCEVGAGYGRISVVLQEFAPHVVAFEREQALACKGSCLHPTLDYRIVDSIQRLPVADGTFDLALTFTVLQHLTNDDAELAARELARIIRPGGAVLLCEETDEGFVCGDPRDRATLFTVGRKVERYEAMLTPLTLAHVSPRQVEPGYEGGRDVGSYMLFYRRNRDKAQ